MKLRSNRLLLRDTAIAALVAGIVGGVPSTMFALLNGEDVLEATRAAAAMLVSPQSSLAKLLGAAALVHLSISFFWAAILAYVLPRRHILVWSTVAAGAIAVFDLRVIGQLFPEILELSFWPQFADHLVWGLTVGAVLQHLEKRAPGYRN